MSIPMTSSPSLRASAEPAAKRRVTPRRALFAVLLLAAALRLGVLLLFPGVFAFDQTGAIHGSDAYDAYAVNLLATSTYGRIPGVPDASIPPLYSVALAGVYGVFGRGYLQVGIFHTLLDLACIAMLYYIARAAMPLNGRHGRAPARFVDPAWVGVLAGLMYACYPYLIFQNLTLIDTPFFMLLLFAFVLLMALLRVHPRLDKAAWLLAVLGGIVLGLSMLARPILPPLALFVALWFLFKRWRVGAGWLLRPALTQTVLRLLPVALVSLLVLLPWIARNYSVYGAFVPMTTTSGANFWQGNSEYTVPFFRAGYDVQWTSPTLQAADPYSREADAERFALGFEYLRTHPERIPELLWVKFLVHWSIDIAPRYNPQPGEDLGLDENGAFVIRRVNPATGESTDLSFGENDPVNLYDEPLFDQLGRTLHRYYYGVLFVLALVGVLLTLRDWRRVSLLWFVQISMTLVYVFFHPSTRYRVPTDPMLFLFSAYALLWLWLRARVRWLSVSA